MRHHWLFFIGLLSMLLTSATSQPFGLPVVGEWVWPLGGDGYSFIIRQNAKYGTVVENTNYGVRNLDLKLSGPDYITCFDVGGHRIYHAGVDLYPVGPGEPYAAQVRPIADGIVRYRGSGYPGWVFIIEHNVPGVGIIYSLYGHIENPSPPEPGTTVTTDTVLGTVRQLFHDGNFPEFHPDGDDTHLHFEIRTFADAQTIGLPAACNVVGVFGVGYAYPNFPNTYGYLDPLKFIREQQTISYHIYSGTQESI
jgi:murein DD-endopeptidase MepM/ murein hydrolase activator NlpD